jgi:hypothetical protein
MEAKEIAFLGERDGAGVVQQRAEDRIAYLWNVF